MKGCHYCAGERMLVKATIPLDLLEPKKSSGEHPAPPLKALVLVQCPKCQRLETDEA